METPSQFRGTGQCLPEATAQQLGQCSIDERSGVILDGGVDDSQACVGRDFGQMFDLSDCGLAHQAPIGWVGRQQVQPVNIGHTAGQVGGGQIQDAANALFFQVLAAQLQLHADGGA
ncbi:MAG TPA: hypothetical protein EYP56_07605 [Planctomycetaceae bacterium]|nr:hypothetical protein [Planctomycetaceae bacterium]